MIIVAEERFLLEDQRGLRIGYMGIGLYCGQNIQRQRGEETDGLFWTFRAPTCALRL